MNWNPRTALIAAVAAFVFLLVVPLLWGGLAGWQGWGWGMMGPGMMGGFGWMWFMPLIPVAFWGLIVWAVVALVQGSSRPSGSQSDHQDLGLEILKRRYAQGEISKEEYEEKKKDLA